MGWGETLMNPSEYFDLVAQKCVMNCLKELHFDFVDPIVLDLLGQLLVLTITSTATTSLQWASHAGRSKFNILDMYITMRCIGCSSSDLIDFLNNKSPSIPHIRPPNEQQQQQQQQVSPVKPAKCIKLESNYRSKYYYDFLPALPSVHTYKRTISRIIPSIDKAFIAYRKSDERRMIEKNLNNILKSSNLTIHYLNYEA